MTDNSPSKLCSLCNKAGEKVCPTCKSGRYCSRDCQETDWPIHKLVCKAFSEIGSPPSKNHFIAFYLAPDKRKPKPIWLHCPGIYDDGYYIYQSPDYHGYFDKDTIVNNIHIQFNIALNRNIGNTIRILHSDTFLFDGSLPNPAVEAIAGSEAAAQWRGPLVMFGMVGLGVNQVDCRNLDMVDFRHIVDFFREYQTTPPPTTAPQSKPPAKMIQGVRINCVGDQEVFNRPKYETVQITTDHPIFSQHFESDIAKARRAPYLHLEVSRRPNHTPITPILTSTMRLRRLYIVPAATVAMGKKPSIWGMASWDWMNRTGSILVVRRDKKPLLELHMESLARYCLEEVGPMFAHSDGVFYPEKPLTREAVLSAISRAMFYLCFHKVQKEEGVDGHDPTRYEM